MTFIADNTYRSFATLVAEYVPNTNDTLVLTNSIVDLHREVSAGLVDDALDSASHPFRSIIEQQEQELQGVYASLHAERDRGDAAHEILVHVARNDAEVLDLISKNQSILAIKRVRALTGTGLKSAKDAVQDSRVMEAAADAALDYLRRVLTDTFPPECPE